MQFIKDGPEIPDELISLHESGDLVIFCGSGISVPANLPTFGNLVVDIYHHENIGEGHLFDKEEYVENLYPQEEKCYKAFMYDRVLYLLERRLGANKSLCRKALQEILLDTKENPDYRTHEAILDLSLDTRGARKLVTTNYDHCFDACRNEVVEFSSAPMFPVPRKGKWNSVVYLHGKIDQKRDPNGTNLVVTSADFGSAYLTERWASRFTAELFRNFHILFLGYSLNDPIMRYISDAIAADDSLEASEYWKKRYTLVKTNSSEIKDRKEWQSYGIDPIFYESHMEMHSTLREWARHYRSGLTGKDKIIKEASFITPQKPYQNDPRIPKRLSILQESNFDERIKATGHYARVFLESKPIPPIQWLPVLSEYGLLCGGNESASEVSIASHKNMSCYSSPDNVTSHLWRWLSIHLDKKELVDYIVEKGAYLHPNFKHYLCQELSDSKRIIPKVFVDFWNLLIWKQKKNSVLGNNLSYHYLQQHTTEEIGSEVFLELLQPSINLQKKPLWWENADIKFPDDDLRQLVKGEVVIEDYHVVNHIVNTHSSYPECLIEQLPLLVQYLAQTLNLTEIFDGDAESSLLAVQSIADHEQNRVSKSWTLLVRVIRDVWIAADKKRPRIADAVIQLWMTQTHKMFTKLILHAFSVSERIPFSEKIAYLLAEESSWITSYHVRRDLFDFIRGNSSMMTSEYANLILGRVISLLEINTENDNGKERVIWFFLKSMKKLGFTLNKTASDKLYELTGLHKNWKFSSDDREEFSMYMHPMAVGYQSDINSEQLYKYSLKKRVEMLSDTSSRYHEDRANEFKQMTYEHGVAGYNTLKELAKKKLWLDIVWSNGLSGLKESKYGWTILTEMLSTLASDEFLNSILFTLTHDWLIEMCSSVEADSKKEKALFTLLDKLIAIQLNSEQRTKPGLIQTDIGSVVEVIINRAGLRNLSHNDQLPDSIKERLETVISGLKDSNNYGCTSISSRLFYFFAVDPGWTRAKLLPLFQRNSHQFVWAWSGFLMNPQSNVTVLVEIAPLLCSVMESCKEFDKGIRASIFHLFARICLDTKETYTEEEILRELQKMGNFGRREVSHFLHLRLANIDKNRRSNYWEEFIRKFLILWPKDESIQDSDVSFNLFEVLLCTEESFPEALSSIKPITSATDKFEQLLFTINTEDIALKYPQAVLELLVLAVNLVNVPYQAKKIREVIDACILTDQSLADTPNYRTIERIISV